MLTYRIESFDSGAYMGGWDASSPEHALELMYAESNIHLDKEKMCYVNETNDRLEDDKGATFFNRVDFYIYDKDKEEISTFIKGNLADNLCKDVDVWVVWEE